MSEREKLRLVNNIAASLSRVGKKDIIERSIANFRSADAEYSQRLATAMCGAASETIRKGNHERPRAIQA